MMRYDMALLHYKNIIKLHRKSYITLQKSFDMLIKAQVGLFLVVCIVGAALAAPQRHREGRRHRHWHRGQKKGHNRNESNENDNSSEEGMASTDSKMEFEKLVEVVQNTLKDIEEISKKDNPVIGQKISKKLQKQIEKLNKVVEDIASQNENPSPTTTTSTTVPPPPQTEDLQKQIDMLKQIVQDFASKTPATISPKANGKENENPPTMTTTTLPPVIKNLQNQIEDLNKKLKELEKKDSSGNDKDKSTTTTTTPMTTSAPSSPTSMTAESTPTSTTGSSTTTPTTESSTTTTTTVSPPIEMLQKQIEELKKSLQDLTSSTKASRRKREVEAPFTTGMNQVGDILVGTKDEIKDDVKQLSPPAKEKINKRYKRGLKACKADSCRGALGLLE